MGIAPKNMSLASRRVTLVATVAVACMAVSPGLAGARSKHPDSAVTQLANQTLRAANHDSRAGFTRTGWAATATSGLTTGVQVSNKAYRAKNKTNYFVALLTSTDLSTGASTKLLSRRGTIPLGLVTGYGHTYGLWFRIESFKRQRFRMQLMELSDPSKPRAIFSTRVNRDDYCLPGRLTGVTAQGEAVLVRPLDADGCDYDYEQAYYGDYGRITAVAPDGQQRQLVARSRLDGPVVNRGNFMLYRKGIRSVLLNLATGASSDLWDGTFNYLDLSASGDVLLNAPVDRDSASGCDDCEDPLRPSNPLLLFLSGAATPPVFLDPPSIKKFSIGTFCGGGYVKLVAQRKQVGLLEDSYDDNPFADILASTDGSMRSTIAGPVGVELRTIAGSYVRTLGAIDEDLVSPPICIGTRVTVPTDNLGGRPGGSKFYTFEAGA
ncbi:MAG: hypothetical protein JHC87_06390 [Thermoleophilaceae bacterium]|nr:hypothetical protein [Thermoleophilaceae bacterium]